MDLLLAYCKESTYNLKSWFTQESPLSPPYHLFSIFPSVPGEVPHAKGLNA